MCILSYSLTQRQVVLLVDVRRSCFSVRNDACTFGESVSDLLKGLDLIGLVVVLGSFLETLSLVLGRDLSTHLFIDGVKLLMQRWHSVIVRVDFIGNDIVLCYGSTFIILLLLFRELELIHNLFIVAINIGRLLLTHYLGVINCDAWDMLIGVSKLIFLIALINDFITYILLIHILKQSLTSLSLVFLNLWFLNRFGLGNRIHGSPSTALVIAVFTDSSIIRSVQHFLTGIPWVMWHVRSSTRIPGWRSTIKWSRSETIPSLLDLSIRSTSTTTLSSSLLPSFP